MRMAAKIKARLQRTQRGQDEIRKKSHSLTQSERLILVLVDGLSSIDVLKRKLPGVVDRRFKLAVADLKAKGFVEEVARPTPYQGDALDGLAIECYVRQDPLDPVTITALSLQPESLSHIAKPALAIVDRNEMSAQGGELVDGVASGVDIYLPLEAKAAPQAAPKFEVPVASNLITSNSADQRQGTSHRRMKRARRSRYVQIGYWLLFVVLVSVVIAIVLMRSN
jgi:hypothetical protein